MNKISLSVIIPTHNPHPERLAQVIEALSKQTLDPENWEVIVIDNNSSNDTLENISYGPIPHFRIVLEYWQGLTYARLKGFAESKGDYIVMVDDDNILDEKYLETVKVLLDTNRKLGAVGGKSIAQLESDNYPPYFEEIKEMLAIRDLGEETISFFQAPGQSITSYPACSPIGAGMGIRKSALANYIAEAEQGKNHLSDRKGNELSSGGDNDIILSLIKSGFGVSYSPLLILYHIIPSFRLSRSYLGRLNHDSSKSWIAVLAKHNIYPWPLINNKWSIPLRKMRSYIIHKAWESDLQYIRWRGACGLFEGRASIQSHE